MTALILINVSSDGKEAKRDHSHITQPFSVEESGSLKHFRFQVSKSERTGLISNYVLYL